MAHYSESALKLLSETPLNETKLTLYLFCLVGSLLGFVPTATTPVYLPTEYTEAIGSGVDIIELMQNYRENSVSIRKKLISQLKESGLDDYQISVVFNTTVYQVKKLLKNL
jgi:hypothetical protein